MNMKPDADELLASKSRRWMKEHPERAREIRKKYELLHPGKETERKKKWKIEHPEKVKEGRAKNKIGSRASCLKWIDKNEELQGVSAQSCASATYGVHRLFGFQKLACHILRVREIEEKRK